MNLFKIKTKITITIAGTLLTAILLFFHNCYSQPIVHAEKIKLQEQQAQIEAQTSPDQQQNPSESEIIKEGKCGDDVYFKLYKNGTLVISGSGDMYDIFKLDPNTDISHGTSHFFSCEGFINSGIPIHRIIIQEGVTRIGSGAFCGLGSASVRKVSIPYSVKTIGDIAFKGLRDLTEINIPNSVESIGISAFEDCKNLEFAFLSKLTQIDENTFNYCKKLKIVYSDFNYLLDDQGTLTIYGPGAMPNYRNEMEVPWHKWRKDIVRVDIKDNLTAIGNYAFKNCSNLKNIILPNTLNYIGKEAFLYCNKLSEIRIPSSVENIEYNAFDKNIHLLLPEINTSWCFHDVSSFEDTGNILREIMLSHKAFALMVLDLKAHDFSSFGCKYENIIENIYREALKSDDKTDLGDLYGSVKESNYTYKKINNKLQVKFNLTYYSTLKHEKAVNETIAKVVKEELNISGKSEFQKIKAIYDYTTYFYSMPPRCKFFPSNYAIMLYKLCKEAGINARVINIQRGEDNRSNMFSIVRIGRFWYVVDPFLDEQQVWSKCCYHDNWNVYTCPYKYFLLSYSSYTKSTNIKKISEHSLLPFINCSSSEFCNKYLMSPHDYCISLKLFSHFNPYRSMVKSIHE